MSEHQQTPEQPQPPSGYGPPQPPAPKPRMSRGKKIGIGVGIVFTLIIVGSIAGGGEDSGDTGKDKAAAEQPKDQAPAAKDDKPVEEAKDKPEPKPEPKPKEAKPEPEPKKDPDEDKAVFKVWGSAPAGADITYGSDSENIAGKGLPLTKKLAVNEDAMYYVITAQLQGGGDIHCSVTIDGQTKKGHAVGDFNICSAQMNSNFMGEFE